MLIKGLHAHLISPLLWDVKMPQIILKEALCTLPHNNMEEFRDVKVIKQGFARHLRYLYFFYFISSVTGR